MSNNTEIGTEAVHAQSGSEHYVAVSQLRVLLLKENAGWFAQGLEIDYAATGVDIEEAKRNFESGFYKTVHEHITLQGSIENLLKIAPQEAWSEYFVRASDSLAEHFSCVQLHSMKEKELLPVSLPFNQIAFISNPQEAMAA